jgi:hypothetical protein
MASRVEYAVSITPIREITATGDYDAHDVIANDIGKSLGGSASVSLGEGADHTTVGYGTATKGVVVYKEAIDSAYTVLGADATAYKTIFIKHTGKVYGVSATTLGVTTNINLDVFLKISGTPSYLKIASLEPSGAMVLPNFSNEANKGIYVKPASGTGHIAVEYALIS